jgi:hypothetical protein
MSRGPLPDPQARRRNAPTIPTTNLPAGGRKGRAPRAPYKLDVPGADWWRWAWSLPQAVAWSSGDLYALARRARLEDDIAALRGAPELELEPLVELMAQADVDTEALNVIAEHIRYVLGVFQSLAGQKSTLEREMRELDDRFGLTPKGLVALRWTITKDPETQEPPKEKAPVRRLRAVDPAAAAG